jgi:catechol 2,3-dioxygenase-like lactoylglutathione lyase family enzyme
VGGCEVANKDPGSAQIHSGNLREKGFLAAWHTGTLGLPVQAGGPAAGYSVFGAGNCQLVVEPVPDAPADEQFLVGRFTGLSFTVPDIHAKHRELQARGVQFTGEPELQFWGGTLATLRDPAGNELQLVQVPHAA